MSSPNSSHEPPVPIRFVSNGRLWRRGVKRGLLIAVVLQALLALTLLGKPEITPLERDNYVNSPIGLCFLGGIACAIVVARGYHLRCPRCGSFASLRFVEATLLGRRQGLANVRTTDRHYNRNWEQVGTTQSTRLLMVTTELYKDDYICCHCGRASEKQRREQYT
jgi:hypothetical protein